MVREGNASLSNQIILARSSEKERGRSLALRSNLFALWDKKDLHCNPSRKVRMSKFIRHYLFLVSNRYYRCS